MGGKVHLAGGMDCVTSSYERVAGTSATEKEQKFVPFSFHHDPPPLSLFGEKKLLLTNFFKSELLISSSQPLNSSK